MKWFKWFRYPEEDIGWEADFLHDVQKIVGEFLAGDSRKKQKTWDEFSKMEQDRISAFLWIPLCFVVVPVVLSLFGAFFLLSTGIDRREAFYMVLGDPFAMLSFYYFEATGWPEIPLRELQAPLLIMCLVGIVLLFLIEWYQRGRTVHPRVAQAGFFLHDFLRHRVNAFRQWRIVMAARGLTYWAGISVCRIHEKCHAKPIGIVYFKTAKGESRKMKFCIRHNPLEDSWSKWHFSFRKWEIQSVFFFEEKSAYYHDVMFP